MKTKFTHVPYGQLTGKQQESRNFHKVAAALADYGYDSIRLCDDWEGADFFALHIDGKTVLRVQLKGRFGFDKKYRGKNLWIAFRDNKTGKIFIYQHDKLLSRFIAHFEKNSSDWRNKGKHHFPGVSPENEELLTRLTPNPQE